MLIKKYIPFVLLLAFFGSEVSAQNSINVVTTAVPFLRISPDARSGGMGETGIATTPDVNAILWNTGKLPFTEKKGGINANYSPWLRDWSSDMYLASLSGYYKLNDEQALHLSTRYFSMGNLQFTDLSGNHLQSFQPREFDIEGGYSRKISNRLGVGVTLKYIHSNLATDGAGGSSYHAGNAVAGDIGFYYNAHKANGEGWSFGGTLSNLGSKISYTDDPNQKDYIPANLGLGAAWIKTFNTNHKLQFAMDINKLLVPTPPTNGDSATWAAYHNKSVMNSWVSSFGDAPGGFSEELKEFQVSLGAEYWYNNQFALRAGYFYEDKTKGDRRFFSAGASVKYNVATLNFSYVIPSGSSMNKNPLSNTLRVGLQFDILK